MELEDMYRIHPKLRAVLEQLIDEYNYNSELASYKEQIPRTNVSHLLIQNEILLKYFLLICEIYEVEYKIEFRECMQNGNLIKYTAIKLEEEI